MSSKILFCDIDGTLTETISGRDFKQHPQDVKVIEGADKALAYFVNKGYQPIGISNQGGVTAGHKTIAAVIEEMQFTLELLPALGLIYFCPDYEGKILWSVTRSGAAEVDTTDLASCRKPRTGMIDYVFRNYGGNPTQTYSVMTGDRYDDQECAADAGINFMWAEFWREEFKTGVFTHQVTPEQLRFLEDLGGG